MGDAAWTEATASIEAIAVGLRNAYVRDEQSQSLSAIAVASRAALESGRAGAAVFFAYLAKATGIEAHREYAEQLLREAVAVSRPRDTSGLLHTGSVGIAWALTHLGYRFGAGGAFVDTAERFVQDVDSALLERVSISPWTEDYDLISGLVGYGLYALERSPIGTAVQMVEQIVARLDELAEHQPDGITWWTSPSLTRRPDLAPNGWYNLGLAHGVPGVIGFLAQVIAAGVAVDRARALFDGTVSWLLAQRLPEGAGCHFAAWVQADVTPVPHRQTWCYGDLGVACAVMVAAQSLEDSNLMQDARAIALDVATRPFSEGSVDESMLCHGAIGNAHMLRRLFQMLGDEALGTAAGATLQRGLAMRRPNGLLGGFSVQAHDPERPTRRIAYRGLLNGAAGIGLALLAATTPVEPAWDRIFMLSPVRPAGIHRR